MFLLFVRARRVSSDPSNTMVYEISGFTKIRVTIIGGNQVLLDAFECMVTSVIPFKFSIFLCDGQEMRTTSR